MELKVLGSSSNGNCYILDNGKEALIIEAGVRFQEVKKALGYNLRKVVGCLITHKHNDHAKYIKAMVDNGFHTLALADVWENKGVWGSRSVAIVPKHGYKLGRFKVLPFNACHDVPCVGYLIEHPECGRIMFLTDSCECLSLFPRLNHILIECNYSMPKLIEAVNAGVTPKSQIDRLPNSHMELQTCKAVLSELDLANVYNIVLLHLSDHNSDRLKFVSEIERQTGKAVYAPLQIWILTLQSSDMAKVLVEKRKGLFTLQPLYEWFRQVCDGMYRIEVKRMRKPRSNDQNGWLWGCIYPMLLDALLEAGWEFVSVEQVHEYFKNMLAKDCVVNRHTGEIVEFPISTATMDTLTFSTYCEKLREYGREYLGIEIPDPDKYWRTSNDTST